MIEILNKLKTSLKANYKNLLALLGVLFLVVSLAVLVTLYFASLRLKNLSESYEGEISELQRELSEATAKEKGYSLAEFPNYGVTFNYPKDLFIKDCSATFSPATFSVRLADVINKVDCNTSMKNNSAILLGVTTEQELKNEKSEKAIVSVDGKTSYYVVKTYELRGDEGEVLVSAPRVKSIITYVPYKNGKFLRISHTRIISIKNNEDGFKVDASLEEEYSYLIKTLKIN